MLTSLPENIIGQKIWDEYGSIIGTILGTSYDENGFLKNIVVATGDGDVRSFSSQQVVFTESKIVSRDLLTIRIEHLIHLITVSRRRVKVIDRLYREGRMSSSLFTLIKERDEKLLKTRIQELNNLLEELRRKLESLSTIIDLLSETRADLEIRFQEGEIDESLYRELSERISSLTTKQLRKKSRLESLLERGSKALSEEESVPPETELEKQPPVAQPKESRPKPIQLGSISWSPKKKEDEERGPIVIHMK